MPDGDEGKRGRVGAVPGPQVRKEKGATDPCSELRKASWGHWGQGHPN